MRETIWCSCVLRGIVVMVVGIRVAFAAEVTIAPTADGSYLQYLSVDGRPLPLLPQDRAALGAGFSFREMRPAQNAANIVPNAGLEDRTGETLAGWEKPGAHCSWDATVNHTPGGGVSGKVGLPVEATAQNPMTSGALRSLSFPAKPQTLYQFSAWGRLAEGTSAGTLYAVELDAKGEIIWEGKHHVQHAISFPGDAPGEWKQRSHTFSTKPNCAKLHIYANIWKGHGTFWFDDVSVTEIAAWEESGPLGLAPQPTRDLKFDVRQNQDGGCVRFDVAVQETHEPVADRALRMRFVLPVDGRGWTWGDDIRRARKIEEGTVYENSFNLKGRSVSWYPFASVWSDRHGLALAAPMDCPRISRLFYDPKAGLGVEFDLGLSAGTKKIGPGRATFSFVLYAHDPKWGFRAAAKRYYELFPQFFVKRIERGGLWFFAVPIMDVPGPEDFGIVFYECGVLPKKALDYCREHKILTFKYVEPWGAWQPFYESKGEKPSYEERIAYLQSWTQNKDPKLQWLSGPRGEIAQSVLNSSLFNAEGKYWIDGPSYFWHQWGKYWHQNWPTNPDPDLPMPNRGRLCKQYEIDPVLQDQDGVYLDSVEASGWSWSGLPNVRGDHLAVADVPPVFDLTSGKPALLHALSDYEFIAWLESELRKQNKLVMMNIFSEGYRFYAHMSDLLGSEISDIESDERSVLRLTLSYQKPNSNLMQRGWGKAPIMSREEMAAYIKHQMFYGFFPGVGSAGGEVEQGFPSRYFAAKELRERDRDLFKQLIPITCQVFAAGWEPITGARTSDQEVHVERFGAWAKNNLHFTLRNEAETSKTATLTLDLQELGVTETETHGLTATELIGNRPVMLKGGTTLTLTVPAKDTMVVKLAR
ncbi:MAG: hypothetical protein AB1696_20530 [Planctomycetota bacterium]